MKPAGGWTDAFLDHMRMTADPIADQVMATVFELHGLERVNQLLSAMGRSPTLASPDDIATLINDYLAATRALPSWYDAQKVQLAEDFFYKHGLTSIVALFYASLPLCYVMRNEAEVLQLAGQLEAHTERRIRETARMIFPVMDAGGMAAGGGGVLACQKVRLMHACIRHLILHRDAAHKRMAGLGDALVASPWDVAAQGLPINQEQLAYTMLTFGFTFVTSSRKLGIGISKDEALAYLHIWNVVGHILGVRDELMPETWDEAVDLFAILTRRGMGATENGRRLAAALVAVQQKHMPWTWLKPAGPIITRHLIGKEAANTLGIRNQGSLFVHVFLSLILLVVRAVDAVFRALGREFSIVRAFSRFMARHIVQPILADQTRPLVIRGELLDHWNLKTASVRVR